MDPADLTTPTAAFLFGLLGSAHCVAMCGGIAAALALRAPDPRLAALHSLGRVLGYTIAGALVGGVFGLTVGGVAAGSNLVDAERALRMVAALLLIAIGLRTLFALPAWRALERLGASVWRSALAPLAQLIGRAEGPLAALGLGMLWGWLPCAMSWTALLAAAVAGDAVHGALTMVAFGAGTLPALGFGGFVIGRLANPLRAPAGRRLAGALLVVLGLWTGYAAVSDATNERVEGHPAHAHHRVG